MESFMEAAKAQNWAVGAQEKEKYIHLLAYMTVQKLIKKISIGTSAYPHTHTHTHTNVIIIIIIIIQLLLNLCA
jgi:hypothetical protein